MELGTIGYKGKIYNLDYMKENEIQELYELVEKDKAQNFEQAEKITKITKE